MTQTYRTLRVARSDEGVLSVVIDAPPMNLIGPELVRNLVTLLSELESDEDIRVMVLESADPEYFVPHVDLTKVAEYTAEAAKAGGPDDASLGMLWHKLSELPVVTIAKLRGRARGSASRRSTAWRTTNGSGCTGMVIPGMVAIQPWSTCARRCPTTQGRPTDLTA
jgi:enoyl-CoA hydratase/carnithine racemase